MFAKLLILSGLFVSLSAASHPNEHGLSCNLMKLYRSNCSEFRGELKKKCEVCRFEKTCLFTYDGMEREFCEAYKEGKSCFISFKNANDIAWCRHLKENNSCMMAFSNKERERCESGDIPKKHYSWLNW